MWLYSYSTSLPVLKWPWKNIFCVKFLYSQLVGTPATPDFSSLSILQVKEESPHQSFTANAMLALKEAAVSTYCLNVSILKHHAYVAYAVNRDLYCALGCLEIQPSSLPLRKCMLKNLPLRMVKISGLGGNPYVFVNFFSYNKVFLNDFKLSY